MMMDKLLKDAEAAEKIAHDILSLKNEVVSLDYKRNKNREALRYFLSLYLYLNIQGSIIASFVPGPCLVKTKTGATKRERHGSVQGISSSKVVEIPRRT